MTKLLDALRKKFKTPEAAIAALGLDAALIAMDASFEEGSHPRDESGKFSATGGGISHPSIGYRGNQPKEVHEESQKRISSVAKSLGVRRAFERTEKEGKRPHWVLE